MPQPSWIVSGAFTMVSSLGCRRLRISIRFGFPECDAVPHSGSNCIPFRLTTACVGCCSSATSYETLLIPPAQIYIILSISGPPVLENRTTNTAAIARNMTLRTVV